MGIMFRMLPFFDLVNKYYSFRGKKMASLGSQQCFEPESLMAAYADMKGYPNFRKTFSVRDLFKDRFGLEEYIDYDFNNSADIKIDFSVPVPQTYYNSCDIFLDSGTTEHIMNVASVFQNMHDMLRVGGIIIRLTPFTYTEHGYFNFNRKLFLHMSIVNNYAPIADGYCFPESNKDGELSGVQIMTIQGKDTSICKDIEDEINKDRIKRGILYIQACMKVDSNPFKCNSEVWD